MLRKIYPTLFVFFALAIAGTRVQAQCTMTIAVSAGGILTCASGSIPLDITINGGTPPYMYAWSNSATTQSINVNVAGNYCVTVTDALSCTATGCATVLANTQPPSVSVNPSSVVLNCITTSVTPNVIVFPGTVVSWGGPSPTPPFIQAGFYVVTATDPTNGCTATASLTVNVNTVLPIAAIVPPPPLDCQNPQITLSGAGSTTGPNYVYTWTSAAGNITNGANTLNPVVNAPGTYTLVVTNTTNGCTAWATTTVVSSVPIMTSLGITNPKCSNSADGAINPVYIGGTPPITYLWWNGSTSPNQTNLPAGSYGLTVTDGGGCIQEQLFTLTAPPPIVVTVSELSNDCGSATLQAAASGGTGTLTFNWNGGVSGPLLLTSASDLYTVTVTDVNGCTVTASQLVQVAPIGPCASVSGTMGHDENDDCTLGGAEPGFGGWIVTATSPAGTYYALSAADGSYTLNLPPGEYTVQTLPPSAAWTPCPGPFTTGTLLAGEALMNFDLPVRSVDLCPAMTVDLSIPILRRCFSTNQYTVQYCNNGTDVAANAYVLLTLDPFLTPNVSSIPYQNLGNSVYRFEVGTVGIGQCGSFWVKVTLSCAATLGQTHCSEAHIFPDTTCQPPNPLWSGASLDIAPQCDGDSVYFVLRNVGTATMTVPLEYIVVEDAVMLMIINDDPLEAGDSLVVAVPADGSTWRVEAEQEPFHPGDSAPSATVEGCSVNGSFSLGFVNQFPQNDADPWIDIDCTTNVGAYDPNDKQGIPIGHGPEHYIRPETEIEYRIRFQNTGTDTAFNIVVIDTLAEWLDPASLRPGGSSHPYTLDLYGNGVLNFEFANILLPDSNINEPLSHGYVTFSIKPKIDAPLESVIENRAAIYFDFNDPIITNTTFHQLHIGLTTLTATPDAPGITLKAAPNPFIDETRLTVGGLPAGSALTFRLYTADGRLVRTLSGAAPGIRLLRGDLAAGLYFYRLEHAGRWIGSGKLDVR